MRDASRNHRKHVVRSRAREGPARYPTTLEPRNKIVFLNILALSRLPRLPQRSCREVRSVVLRASYADASRHDVGVVLTISSVPPSRHATKGITAAEGRRNMRHESPGGNA